MATLECVRSFATRAEAELAKSLLEAEGIASVLAVDDVGGMRPEIGFTTGGARLLVVPRDVQRATATLEGLGLERPDAAESQRLRDRGSGCATPAFLGLFLFIAGGFVSGFSDWLGGACLLIGVGLFLLGLYRGTRAS